MYKFEKYQLGINNDEVAISSSDEHHLSATMMAQQCSRDISIISRELDPQVYNLPLFADAVKNMLLANRRAKMRIMVFESRVIVRRGHLLLNLAANLPSFIEFRKPGNEYMGSESAEMGAHSPTSIGGSPVGICLYVEEVDTQFARAITERARCRPVRRALVAGAPGRVQTMVRRAAS